VPDTIITLNCLLSPSGVAQRSNLSEGSVTTLKISTNETVDQLRIMIRERWPHLFEKVPPAEFLLWKINDTEGVTSIEKQIEKFVRGERLNETGMPPH
ncbi:462_t:CDS:1, partial [Rhizophagus irregularis]